MYLGRHQLGNWLPIYLQVTDSDGEPALPDLPPAFKVRRSADEVVVYAGAMPVFDKTVQVGLFCTHLFLGSWFAVGPHTVELLYKAGSKQTVEARAFEVIPGGDARGTVLAMYYLHKPQADFIVYQAESGLILKGKNPRVA